MGIWFSLDLRSSFTNIHIFDRGPIAQAFFIIITIIIIIIIIISLLLFHYIKEIQYKRYCLNCLINW